MIAPAPFAPSPLPPRADVLRVLPLSDLHLPKPTSRLILDNRAFLKRADYVVFLGDMVRAYGTDREYDAVREFVGEMARPYTAVSGNHEWFFEEFDENSGSYAEVWADSPPDMARSHLQKFRDFWRLDALWRAFDSPLGHFVFLSLDRIGTRKQETLSAAQLAFLESEVRRAGAAPLFVWCHAPLLLDARLDMVYYDEERTGCIEPQDELRDLLLHRAAPTLWMSGHIHLHPDHYLFLPYRSAGNCTQVHCPDSWGYGRWTREQRIPELYAAPFSRLLEIDANGVTLITHDHSTQRDRETYRITF